MNRWILALCATLLVSACDTRTLAEHRAEYQRTTRDDVVIAVAWPLKSSKATLAQGVELAAEEINRAGGILGGRKIRLVMKDDAGALNTGRMVAQEIADDPRVAAVIGHLNSYIAAPAAQIYERAGLLMMTPGASGQKVTEQGGQLTFRSLPQNREQARQIGDYAAARGYRNVAIYYIKNDYGVDLANCFEQRARELGITIADRRSYSMGGDNYAAILADWASFLNIDSIFLVGSLPESPEILRAVRNAGLTVPVFGGAGLDSPELIRKGGDSVEGTVVFSLFNAGERRPEVHAFGERYRARYGALPDSTAAQGYDTLKLLVHGMTRAGSADSARVAQQLRATRDWQGVTGVHSFDEQGNPVAKRLAKVVVRHGKFEYFDLPGGGT